MVKKKQSGTDLVNFHFSSPAPAQQQNAPRRMNSSGSNPNAGNQNRRNRNGQPRQSSNTNQQQRRQYQRTKEDRASARKKASGQMFFLHSSPDHAFNITRRPGKHQTSPYSFHGCDEPVSWEAVRSVKYFAAAQQKEACPVCLDTFTCARITKCGHCFCLTCLLHHVHASAANNPYAENSKCPCCASVLVLSDLRPVEIISVIPPALNQTIRFTKLHRSKGCSAPFLPLPEYPRRSSPHAAPCQTDADALYCRFNYVDIEVYSDLLAVNLREIQAAPVYSDVEAICRSLALETVQKEMTHAAQEAEEEQPFVDRFQNAAAGVYQSQPKNLLAANYQVVPVAAEAPATVHDEETVDAKNDADDSQVVEHGEARRYRGDSISSELSAPQSPTGRSRGRSRGDSITSHDTMSTTGGGHRQERQQQQLLPGGSMYLGEEESAFYQTDDGRLCFLSGFNMNCLRTEFTPHLPEDGSVFLDETLSFWQRRKLSPLPDHVEGRVLEVDHVHLTSELRQRLRFLSHLPLYLDICFVEISLGNILSNKTKKVFSKEFNKRKQARSNKVNAEKRADARARKIEEKRVNERKANMQRIDPNDEFFMPRSPVQQEPIASLTGEEFGPSISQSREGETTAVEAMTDVAHPGSPVVSFAAATRTGGAFPSLTSLESAFPALGASVDASSAPTARTAPTPAPWGRSQKSAPEHVASTSATATAALPQGGKKKKGKKVLLFSTGSHRGGA